ncbi:MAG: DUF1015 domain-containing protein [Treponema sp.]|jgi:uncharacterized protein (DUF1015 family)|nr:DUF1015 domain-containing protein [Treponema sp.]
MDILKKFGIEVPSILLPAKIDLKTWAVIACDQYTQDKNYWISVEKNIGTNPSTFHLILPEIYLNESDKEKRIAKIQKTMKEYLQGNLFAPERKNFMYTERKTAYGRIRHGLIAAIDLDTYEWKPFSKSLVRATEATIKERIPPRMEIRQGAQLESPHIMLLINDPHKQLVEKTGESIRKTVPAYKGELMQNGGYITGWNIDSAEHISEIEKAIEYIATQNTDADGSVFLFAVGDGNHSLATAKAVWDEYKKEQLKKGIPLHKIEQHNARYALVEIVNLYDDGLTFEPIHRVLFGADPDELCTFVAKKLDGKIRECKNRKELEAAVNGSNSCYGFVYKNGQKQNYLLLKTAMQDLAISRLQPVLDEFTATAKKVKTDFIHGSETVFKLGSQPDTTAVLLPPIEKNSFFSTINTHGPLPRKSFSMGEADEKRFYIECRKLF